jgi:hypothetical protein
LFTGKNIQRCIATGNPGKKTKSNKGGTLYAVRKIGRFDVLNIESFDHYKSNIRYDKNGKAAQQGKCYTEKDEKFEKERGICCLKIRAATIQERTLLKQNFVCEISKDKQLDNVYSVKSKDSINFAGNNDCKEIEEALKPREDPISELIDKNAKKKCKNPKFDYDVEKCEL